ncbi:PD-(D/E)XK nuclease family protein [Bacteroides pyogenes]|uniref:PDDEXK-like family protein n=1 Tax=Bacteroides pyogenes TaxID=310300 RepID=UPI002FD8A81C
MKPRKVIGNKNEDATEGGRIDITINIGNRLFIIENKIYAHDQIHQLLRYDNYAKSSQKEYELFYLTLDGKNASDNSITDALGNKTSYAPLSYKEHILAWLYQCVRMAYGKPLVRETLTQYIEIIKKLTHQDMDTNFSEAVVGAALGNIDAAWAIMANQEKIKEAFWRKNIFNPLEKLAKEKHLSYGLWRDVPEDNNMIVLQKEGWTGWILINSTHNYLWKDMSIGITFKKETIIHEKLECMSNVDPSDGWWPYGQTPLPIEIRHWTDFETFGNAEKCNKIIKWFDEKIDEIVSEVEAKGIMIKEV